MLTNMNGYGSTLGGLMFMWCPWLAIISQFFPRDARFYLQHAVEKLVNYVLVRFFGVTKPSYVRCSFHEYSNKIYPLNSNLAYLDVEAYLSLQASKTCKYLRAHKEKKENKLVISLDLHETITEEHCGATVTWSLISHDPSSDEGVRGGGGNKQQKHQFGEENSKRYVLMFDEVHRKHIMDTYLDHVVKQGAALRLKGRQRKIYKNVANYRTGHPVLWNPMEFKHSANFDTLAMELEKKKEIMDDLRKFSASKDYYAKIGKAWKRGYLLYGPPGTGKSTMIAAMANFLDYDVYDLELTSVMSNTDLFRHLMEISDRSILVIEDIDCSLDLTGEREKDKKPERMQLQRGGGGDNKSKITLSGLLNFVDGIWSSSGGERIIVFTTNHLEKLDPALIRRGRMDKHIELSYCRFEAFKVLAKNYLDLESHPLFDTIKTMIEEINITPADVAENLMPKSFEENADECLKTLIQALEATKAKESLKLEN